MKFLAFLRGFFTTRVLLQIIAVLCALIVMRGVGSYSEITWTVAMVP
ncbi:MAG: hypothetical protein J0G95_00675 [Rhizobiales bacterium]|jgi:hypothetical protein|nr:hypothetical protein [Hyphomicrobiales bacterium]